MEFPDVQPAKYLGSGTAEQQEITNSTWEGHQTPFCGMPKHGLTSQSLCCGGVASMSGREAWQFS